MTADSWQVRPSLLSVEDYTFTIEDDSGLPITALSSGYLHGHARVQDVAVPVCRAKRVTRFCINIQFDGFVDDDEFSYDWEIRTSLDCEGSSFNNIVQVSLPLLPSTAHQCFCGVLDPSVFLDVCDLWKPTGRIANGSINTFHLRHMMHTELR